jgi:selenide,water dikinase
MATLNDRAAAAMNASGAHAATDITGFGLVGHARNIAAASRVTIRIELARVPVFPGALDLVRRGFASGASKRGRSSMKDEVKIGADLDDALVALVFDAETSGGLLIAVAASDAATLERELAAREVLVQRIGECVANAGASIVLA